MSILRSAVLTTAKAIAQDPGGAKALLDGDGAYDAAVEQALEAFRSDRPNVRVVHYTVPSSMFRFGLSGAGAVLDREGLDAWVPGASLIARVYHPYSAAYQNQAPLDRNTWRVVQEPGEEETIDAAEAPTLALAGAGAGPVENGAHTYALTTFDAAGHESTVGATAAITVADVSANGKVSITFPSMPAGAVAFGVYRSEAATVAPLKRVARVEAEDATTPYIDNTADGSLGATAPTTDATAVVFEPRFVLELLAIAPSSGVLRLEFTRPHTVSSTYIEETSILAGDISAFAVLVAIKICEAAARRYVQNTGTSAFQNETIDRRTQSDVMASRVRELTGTYNALVGKGGQTAGGGEGSSVAAAAAVKRFQVTTGHRRGLLWPRG